MPESDPLMAEPDDSLAIFGGWILLAFGVALTVLAFVFREDAAVAPTSLVLGVLCVVLSVVFSRVEGRLKFGTGGLDTTLRRVQRRARQDPTLRDEQKREVIDVANDLVSIGRSRAYAYDSDRMHAMNVNRYVLSDATLYDRARDEVLSFEQRARFWLESNGWVVQEPGAGGPDFIAERDGQRLLIETRVSIRPVSVGFLQEGLTQLMRWSAREPEARSVLVISAPRVSGELEKFASGLSAMSVYVERNGEFTYLSAGTPPV